MLILNKKRSCCESNDKRDCRVPQYLNLNNRLILTIVSYRFVGDSDIESTGCGKKGIVYFCLKRVHSETTKTIRNGI